jgi:hypothetical protein
MQKWNYFVVDLTALPVASWLNQFGSDGWELVIVIPKLDGATVYFKRPAVASAAGAQIEPGFLNTPSTNA